MAFGAFFVGLGFLRVWVFCRFGFFRGSERLPGEGPAVLGVCPAGSPRLPWLLEGRGQVPGEVAPGLHPLQGSTRLGFC